MSLDQNEIETQKKSLSSVSVISVVPRSANQDICILCRRIKVRRSQCHCTTDLAQLNMILSAASKLGPNEN